LPQQLSIADPGQLRGAADHQLTPAGAGVPGDHQRWRCWLGQAPAGQEVSTHDVDGG
jgi:hypothetical protein